GEVLYYKPVPGELAHEIMNIFKDCGVHYHSYFDDRLVMETLSEEGKAYSLLAGVEATVVNDLAESLETNDAMKIMAISRDEEKLLAMERHLKSSYADKLHITRSKPHFLEVMHPEADKSKALEVIARHYKIDREEVMAIGDSYNDMEMIKWAGVGVAMGNAVQALQDRADFVTASNIEEGVAAALHRFILDADPEASSNNGHDLNDEINRN
ncbi:MAG: HAD-IIB family hydrolase, partial [Syntrophomonas sp.]|nr:HAD-IIB family hydrolase [Syntrophomonas sp.]